MEFIDNELQFPSRTIKETPSVRLRLSFTMNDLFYWSTIRQERGLDYPYSRSFNLTTNIIF